LIAVDTSSVIAFLDGESGPDVVKIDEAMATRQLRLPPPVISELLSSPRQRQSLRRLLDELPSLPVGDGFWERVGHSRALVLSKGLRARMIDAMIAQICIDLGIPLITRDADYRHFERWCGLKLAA
jgi:predicted nucleic acid-binding protein